MVMLSRNPDHSDLAVVNWILQRVSRYIKRDIVELPLPIQVRSFPRDHAVEIPRGPYSPRYRRVLFMFLSACGRIVVSILKFSQESKNESLTKNKVAVSKRKSHFRQVHSKSGISQIVILVFSICFQHCIYSAINIVYPHMRYHKKHNSLLLLYM